MADDADQIVRLLSGSVVGGRGRASTLVHAHYDAVANFLGSAPSPGSLNVVLRNPVLFRVESATQFDKGKRRLWHATIGELPIAIYRWRGTRAHVVEILAPMHLRTELMLNDGSNCNIRVQDSVLYPISPAKQMMWRLMWQGREDWYYRGEKYHARLRRIEWSLGLLQR